jgi:hypothetical protein
MIQINWHPSARDLRIFAMGQIVVAAVVTTEIARRGGSPILVAVIPGISSIIGLVGLIQPTRVRRIYVAWMIAVFPIGWFVSHLLLAAVFVLVVIPLGFLLRCLGLDPLERRFDTNRRSYWNLRGPTPPATRYFRPF